MISRGIESIRVAYLLESTALSGGVQVVLTQAEALARRGHRVDVVSPETFPSWYPLARARFERSSFRESRALSEADVRVATFWTTVAPALSGARGPVFHLCQGYEGGFSFYAGRRREIENAYRAPARKLAISDALAARLTELGFGPVESIGQAFDRRAFFPGEEVGAPSREVPVLLLVGPHAADVKGIDVALAGLALWRERGGKFRVRRVSTEPLTDAERKGGLVDEYHRAVPPERMPFAYRASDVFLGPARSGEGFGLPVLEALSCGIPALLSDTPGHREIAGEVAWYFREGDAAALADAVPLLLTKEARHRARALGPRCAERFDPAPVAARLERVFAAALSGAGAA